MSKARIIQIANKPPVGEWTIYTALTSIDQTYRGYQGIYGTRQGRVFALMVDGDPIETPLTTDYNATQMVTYMRSFEVDGAEQFRSERESLVGFWNDENGEYGIFTFMREGEVIDPELV